MKAAPRDASWFRYPSTNGGLYHIINKHGKASCGLLLLLNEDLTDEANNVYPNLRCQRNGCKQNWPDLKGTWL